MNNHETITEMDGKTFYYSFLSGSKKVMEHQGEINKINIFPVPDADTGTNMASTIRFIIDNTQPNDSLKITMDSIAEAALDGARGNSGVIFAQFFYGLSQSLGQETKIVMSKFAAALKKAVEYTYEAIAKPAEGTILTVIKRWVNYISDNVHKTLDYVKMFRDSYAVAHHTMENERMEEMRKANIVDAGAKGFVLFLEGMKEFLHKRDTQSLEHLTQDIVLLEQNEETPLEMGEFRYCTEAQLQGEALDKSKIRARIEKWGNSMVVAGSERKIRIHIHTDNPAGFFQDLRELGGDIVYQKADDMLRQYESAHHRKFPIALVTDSSCDLPQALLDQYQVHMVPIGITVGKNHYLDKITLTPNYFYDLMNESEEFPSTSQPNLSSFQNLYSFLSVHYEQVLSLHLSEHFSGTFKNSYSAGEKIAKETGKKIEVKDARTLSGTLGLIVLRAAQAIEKGIKFEELSAKVEEWSAKVRLYVAVKTMKNLVRGGRVSPMKGFVANLLGIKPIVSVNQEGRSVIFSKAFSQKGLMRKIARIIKDFASENKIWNYNIIHAHNMPDAVNCAIEMEKIIGKPPAYIQDMSPVVGLNAGLGTVAVALMAE